MKPLVPGSRILIVGGGEFGLSTALALAEGPYATCPHLITIIDRSPTPPSMDAASSDLNKIVRSDYASPFSVALARRAISLWKSPRYSQFYHESGIITGAMTRDAAGVDYVEESLSHNTAAALGLDDEAQGAVGLDGPEAIRSQYPDGVDKGPFNNFVGYFNPNGGWADARGVMDEVCRLVRAAGVNFEVGEVKSLVYDEGKKDVKGVELQDGRTLTADLVVLATGSWTATLLPELGSELLATGQLIGTIQLTPEEADLYRGGNNGKGRVTIVIDGNAFVCFPPNRDNVFKFALHSPGYLNPQRVQSFTISVPRTTLTPGCEDDQIPKEGVEALKAGVAKVYPGLANREWLSSRLCWYTDTPSSDWLLDYHPSYPSLFLATGGNGQAFKFLPVIGELIVKSIYHALEDEEKAIWGWENFLVQKSKGLRDDSGAKILRMEDMAVKEEL